MIPELASLDEGKRAGVLSRAALDLGSHGLNPAAAPRFPDELKLRTELIDSLYAGLAQSGYDYPPNELREKVLDILDEEIAATSTKPDTDAAIDRLSREAALSSDAYKLEFAPEMLKVSDDLPVDDQDLVIDTVHHPDIEEQFGATPSEDEPKLVSIFGRWYNFGRERDRFILVVTAQRTQNLMQVRHFWRIYPDDVSIYPFGKLHELLSKFAGVYGRVFSVEKWSGKFLRHERIEISGQSISIRLAENRPGDKSFVTLTYNLRDGVADVAFGLGTDVNLYRKSLIRHIRHEKRPQQPADTRVFKENT